MILYETGPRTERAAFSVLPLKPSLKRRSPDRSQGLDAGPGMIRYSKQSWHGREFTGGLQFDRDAPKGHFLHASLGFASPGRIERQPTATASTGEKKPALALVSEDLAVHLATLETVSWCPDPDSNWDAFRRGILNPVRLPIPPSGQRFQSIGQMANGFLNCYLLNYLSN